MYLTDFVLGEAWLSMALLSYTVSFGEFVLIG